MRAFVVLRAKRKESSYNSARVQTTRTKERGLNFRRDRREKKKIFQKGAKVFRVYLLP